MLITPGMVSETSERRKCANVEISLLSLVHAAILIGDPFYVTTSFQVQMLTWLPVSLNVKKDESHLVMAKYSYNFFNSYKKRHPHISFSLILAGILCAGEKRFLGNLAVTCMFVC